MRKRQHSTFTCINILNSYRSLVSRYLILLFTFTSIKILTSSAAFHLYQNPYWSCPLSLVSRSLLVLSTFTFIKILTSPAHFHIIKITSSPAHFHFCKDLTSPIHIHYYQDPLLVRSSPIRIHKLRRRHKIISLLYRSVFTAVSQETMYILHSFILRDLQGFQTQLFTAILNLFYTDTWYYPH